MNQVEKRLIIEQHGRVQFITHYTSLYQYLDSASLALEGGCQWIQLRMKETPVDTLKTIALEVQAMCRQYGATFLIDDHVKLVKDIHADGVHLGKNDMPIAEARQYLGEDFIIGGTANTFEDIQAHVLAGADYIGCGPFRYTTTKKNLSPILGLEGYARMVQLMKEANINLPMVAIGGIKNEDIPDILKTGVTGIALSGSILRAKNPIEEMRNILSICIKL